MIYNITEKARRATRHLMKYFTDVSVDDDRSLPSGNLASTSNESATPQNTTSAQDMLARLKGLVDQPADKATPGHLG